MTPRQLFMAYSKGWSDAAGCNSMKKEFLDGDAELKAAYTDGYSDGSVERHDAHKRAAKTYGYTPSIIRVR